MPEVFIRKILSGFLKCKTAEDATVEIVDKCKAISGGLEDPNKELKTLNK